MARVISVGVKNLRSLRSIEPAIELAPITILLGKNSVGKSTFARLFPLLRQSSERRKRSPVLWFGDLVDFGSISKSVSVGESELTLTFGIVLDSSDRVERFVPEGAAGYWRGALRKVRSSKVDIRMILAEDAATQSGVAKRLEIDIFGGQISINFESFQAEVSINGKTLDVPRDHKVFSRQGDLLPQLLFLKEEKSESGAQTLMSARNPWGDSVAQVLKSALHGNTSTTTARRIATQLVLGTPKEIEAAMANIPGPHSWKTFVSSAHLRQTALPNIHRWLLATALEEILERLDSALSKFFLGVRYLKPLRATAERYYRRLDISVSEIDPEGSNFPMFLDTLRHWELRDFQKWLKEHLDIEVHPAREGEQLMVMAKGPNDDRPFNIADMGFGISQVLPIAAQLWTIRRRGAPGSPASVVVLEQPELHLHPEFQARLADVFAGTVTAADSAEGNPTMIVETHSQHLVNRLGQLIESGRLKPTDVKILLFEPAATSSHGTSVRVSTFDESGVLQNWPFGFFEPGL